jgi:hypothetical protein
VYHAPPISFFLVTHILFEEYRLWGSLCNLFQSPVISSLLGPHIFLNTLFSHTSAYVPPSVSAMKFHTHRKEEVKLYFCYILLFSSQKHSWLGEVHYRGEGLYWNVRRRNF